MLGPFAPVVRRFLGKPQILLLAAVDDGAVGAVICRRRGDVNNLLGHFLGYGLGLTRASRSVFSTVLLRLIVKELSYTELFGVVILHRIVKQFLKPPVAASRAGRRILFINSINSYC